MSIFGSAIGQLSYRPSDLVKEAQTKGSALSLEIFSIVTEPNLIVPSEIQSYELLNLNSIELLKMLNETNAPSINIQLPQSGMDDIELELVEIDLNPAGTYVNEMPSGVNKKVVAGKHFRGVVKNNDKSLVAMSIFENEVMGFISFSGGHNYVIGKLKDSNVHILYPDSDLKEELGFECDTAESDFEYSAGDLKETSLERALTDCVRLYLEVDYDIYQDKGSNIASVSNFVSGLFNQVATLYANEQINVVLSPLTIWTQPSPYNSSSSSGMLNAFLANTGAFDGDLAQLLSYKASGGIAYVDGLCRSNPDFSKSFSSINPTYQSVPTYSWSVMVMTHEFGHLFGSQHTHACAWNGNNTAIDGCSTTEGGCSNPGIPSGGGTVMSYCHLTSVGINLNLGFGPQPGNLIRNRVQNASCTQPCGDDGGGGGDDPACTDTEVTFNLLTDNYPGETTWSLTNSAGVVVYSGGPYNTQGQSIIDTWCLVDGCYDFVINDSYGDGICCGYGQGSYDIVLNGQSVHSGGQFGTSETYTLCVGGGNEPTCNDGEQNGTETGVDCGGQDCSPCASCNDGIQNGSETGTDCGGECEDCVTCEDGIQNGDEEGIDCGGSFCASCEHDGDGSNEVFAHFFENGWDGWQDGGSDCYRYFGMRSYEGDYSIRLRDNSNAASTMTSSAYDLSQYNGVEVNFYFYPSSMETGENFWLKYFDGSSWQTVANFVSGTSFNNNSFYVATVPILGSDYSMANNAKFSFQCDASSNADRIYVDAVTVTGVSGNNLLNNEIKISTLQNLAEVDQFDFIEEAQVSPNPAKDQLRVKMNLDNAQLIQYEVVDMLGRTLKIGEYTLSEGMASFEVNIDQLVEGTYFLRITDSDNDHSIKKFIKIR